MSILLLGFDTESDIAAGNETDVDESIKESLSAVSVITTILDEYQAPATFFILGRLLHCTGDEYQKLLAQQKNFDIQSHTYSHASLKPPGGLSLPELDDEVKQTKELIQKFFGVEAMGLRAPGNYYRGLQGYPDRLKIMWDNGIRFLGSDGEGPPEAHFPAPFTQPYWYKKEGFPNLLELPITGFHCTYLLQTIGDQHWKDKVGFPTGEILEELPKTVDEQISVRQKEFQYAIDNDLLYSPGLHPWSIYRFDKKLRCLRSVIEMAKDNSVPIKSFKDYYLVCRSRLKR